MVDVAILQVLVVVGSRKAMTRYNVVTLNAEFTTITRDFNLIKFE